MLVWFAFLTMRAFTFLVSVLLAVCTDGKLVTNANAPNINANLKERKATINDAYFCVQTTESI